jgi:hypothetical protein
MPARQVGDAIYSVDGVSLVGQTIQQVQDHLNRGTGKPIVLSLRSTVASDAGTQSEWKTAVLGEASTHSGLESSFGLVLATHDYNAVDDDEINLKAGDILRADGLGPDPGWLTATGWLTTLTHHRGQKGQGRWVIPVTHIRPLNKCTVQATYDYNARTEDEHSFSANAMVDLVCHAEDPGWLVGIIRSQYLLVPQTHLAGVDEAIAKLPPVSGAVVPPLGYRPQTSTCIQNEARMQTAVLSTMPLPVRQPVSTSPSSFMYDNRTVSPRTTYAHTGNCTKCGAPYVKGQVFCKTADCGARL